MWDFPAAFPPDSFVLPRAPFQFKDNECLKVPVNTDGMRGLQATTDQNATLGTTRHGTEASPTTLVSVRAKKLLDEWTLEYYVTPVRIMMSYVSNAF
ncbi:hypothetical protein EJB05_16545, partial [Eragrostis curvula]